MNNWKEVTVTATEAEGIAWKTYTFHLLKANDSINVTEAVKAACTEYCSTPEGRKTFEGNCDNFNWGDFDAYVPNEICEKYGIRKVDSFAEQINASFDEMLVNESEIYPELVDRGEDSYFSADVVTFDENNLPETVASACIKSQYIPTAETFVKVLEDNMIYYMNHGDEIRNIEEIEEEDAIEEFGQNIIEI